MNDSKQHKEFLSPRDEWDKLSLQEQAEMIKIAVNNNIFNLADIRNQYNEFAEGGELKEWKALNNIDFEIIPDTTFTRDKTGTGSIEYFNSKYPEGVTYPNGYYKPHPMPNKDVILYNPNENDMQDVRLDALHIMPKDATYDALNSLYRDAARNSDVAYNAQKRYKEDLLNYGKENIDSYQQYFNNEADGLLRNIFIEGTPEYIENKRYYPNKEQLKEWNSHLMPYINNIQSYLETGVRPSNILPEVIISPNKKALGGPIVETANTYNGGGWLDTLLEYLGIGNNTKEKPLTYRNRLAQKTVVGHNKYMITPKRLRGNTSKTKKESEKLENQMKVYVVKEQERISSNPNYDIPFIPEKAILIGNHTTSTNALDSVAKYAGIHNRNPKLSENPVLPISHYKAPRKVNLNEIIGLSTRETSNGAHPYINYNDDPQFNRELGNANYFTAFGYIPAENFVRNYHYNDTKVNRNTPPLLDAFQYFAQGDYNRGDPNHTRDVNISGAEAWRNPKIQEWWDTSGKDWYSGKNIK